MKNSQQGLATRSVIIAIVIIIVLIGGYLIYSSKTNAPADSGNNTATTTPNNTATTTPAMVSKVKVFLYAPNDKGVKGTKFGCDDSLVPVTVDITPTQAPLKAALEKLFSIKTMKYEQTGLQTVFYQANLKVDSATVANGVATVKLSGTMSLGGVCDHPRVQSQLEGTIKQFSSVQSVNIFINNKTLADFLSLK